MLPLVIVTLPPTQGMNNYKALLASHGKMTETYTALGTTVIDEKQVAPWLDQQLNALKI